MNAHTEKRLLIHASPEAGFTTLKPLTAEGNSTVLYATGCPVFATLHVLKNKYSYPIFLRRYKIFRKSFTLCRIHNKMFNEVASLKLTHYFMEPDCFIENKKVGRIEKLTLGLIKNTKTVYITNSTITPAHKATITLKDITGSKFLKVYKYHVYASLT